MAKYIHGFHSEIVSYWAIGEPDDTGKLREPIFRFATANEAILAAKKLSDDQE